MDPTIFRPATYIENAVANLNTALLLGVVLVIAVLSVFLYDWRAALISIWRYLCRCSTAALVMNYTGGTIDTMVLAGLIIALGEVVDDAIIDVENIMRRLRRQSRRRLIRVAVLGRAQSFARGPQRRRLRQLDRRAGARAGIYFRWSFGCVLSPTRSRLHRRDSGVARRCVDVDARARADTAADSAAERRPQDSPLVLWLKARYRPLLQRLVHRPRRCLAAVAGAALVALADLPAARAGAVAELPRVRLSDALARAAGHVARRDESRDDSREPRAARASTVCAISARMSDARRSQTKSSASIYGALDQPRSVSAVRGDRSKIQAIVDGYPGLFRDLLTYLRERIKEVLTGTSGAVVVRIYGPDSSNSRSWPTKSRTRLAGIEGVDDLHVQHQTLIPQIAIEFQTGGGGHRSDLRQAIYAGVTEVMLTGVKVGEIYDEQKVFDVVVRGTPAGRREYRCVTRHADRYAGRRRRAVARRRGRVHRADTQSSHARSGIAAHRRNVESRPAER